MSKIPDCSKNTAPNFSFKNLFIHYPSVSDVIDAIEDSLQTRRDEGESKGILVVGDPAVRKTPLIKYVIQRHSPWDAPEGRTIPILACEVPKPATIKGLVTVMLAALGAPRPEAGNTVVQTERLYRLLAGCNVEMIILDEFQHLIDGSSDKVLSDVADWLKVHINRSNVAVVLVGMPQSTVVLDHDEQKQLRRRFMEKLTLSPFDWKIDQGQNYRRFLKLVESSLPLPESSNLSDVLLAARMYLATNGYIGYTTALLRASLRWSRNNNQARIDEHILSRAFLKEIGVGTTATFDPFLVSQEKIESSFDSLTETISSQHGFSQRLRGLTKKVKASDVLSKRR